MSHNHDRRSPWRTPEDATETLDGAPAGLSLRFTTGSAGISTLAPASVLLGKTLESLLRAQAFPSSEIDLAQCCVGPDLEPAAFRQDGGRLPSPKEVAADQQPRMKRRNLKGQPVGLGPPHLVKRGVGLSLKAALGVPSGLAVTGQEETPHGLVRARVHGRQDAQAPRDVNQAQATPSPDGEIALPPGQSCG